MVGFTFFLILLSLLASALGVIIALRIQYHHLEEARQEREGWQQAWEARQRAWEVKQGKNIVDLEKRLSHQIGELRADWRDWHNGWEDQLDQIQMHARARLDMEQEIARLPHVEDVSISNATASNNRPPERWQPPRLYRADLRGRDFSYRYMGHADLREAHLQDTNFYMADLSGANLAQANLENANFAGANLTGVDLRGANLTRTNFLVADLHQALLQGARLTETRNLTSEQIQHAFYNHTSHQDISAEQTRSFAQLPPVKVHMPATENGTEPLPLDDDDLDDETLSGIPPLVAAEAEVTPHTDDNGTEALPLDSDLEDATLREIPSISTSEAEITPPELDNNTDLSALDENLHDETLAENPNQDTPVAEPDSVINEEALEVSTETPTSNNASLEEDEETLHALHHPATATGPLVRRPQKNGNSQRKRK
jgi:hypothetical protein